MLDLETNFLSFVQTTFILEYESLRTARVLEDKKWSLIRLCFFDTKKILIFELNVTRKSLTT